MKIIINKYSLVQQKTHLQMGEVCQPGDVVPPNKKNKQNKSEKKLQTNVPNVINTAI